MIKLTILALLLVAPCFCVLGVDVTSLLSVSNYQCLRNNQAEFVVVNAMEGNGSANINATYNLRNARLANLPTDIYIVPCASLDPVDQVNALMQEISANLYTRVWIKVIYNGADECSWGTDYQSNCEYIVQMINALAAQNKASGVYSSQLLWQQIMGGNFACGQASGVPLWYYNPNGQATFNDFNPFGYWFKPSAKQYYTGGNICGVSTNYDFYQ